MGTWMGQLQQLYCLTNDLDNQVSVYSVALSIDSECQQIIEDI